MVTVQVLSDSEQDEIAAKIREFADLTSASDDTDLTEYLFEDTLSDGDVEVRFFPMPETGAAEELYFEVKVLDSADWYEPSLGAYGADNLRNGGPVHEAFADELETLVKDQFGDSPDFVKQKGHGAFTATVSL